MSKTVKLAIVGSRKIPKHVTYEYTRDKINAIILENDLIVEEVISGGADGIDYWGERYSKKELLKPAVIHKPEYDKYPAHIAPLMRNTTIAEDCTFMIALHDGTSKGTIDVTTRATNLGKTVIIINYNES